jgi:hypothetical protein
MKKQVFALLSLVTGICSLGGCCKPDPTASTCAVTLRPQETNVWCWAACTQMITEFLGHGRTQCDLANQRFGQTNCCSGACDNKTSACTQAGWVMFNESGFSYVAGGATALSWDTITYCISCRRQPTDLIDGPKGGGIGHCRVIYGYANIAGTRYLLIKDPWAPCAGNSYALSYDDYANNTLRDLWTTDHDFTYTR